MYVPLVGLTIAVAWSLPARARTAATVAILIATPLAARSTLQYWRDSETLYRRATQAVPNNDLAWHYLSMLWAPTPEKSIEAARNAARLRPDSPEYHHAVTVAALQLSRFDEALEHAEAAARLTPNEPEPWYEAGTALYQLRRPEDAASRLRRALELNPGHAPAHYLLARLLMQSGATAQALPHLESAVRIDPANALARDLLGYALARQGRSAEALPHLEEAVRLNPGNETAQRNLAALRQSLAKGKP